MQTSRTRTTGFKVVMFLQYYSNEQGDWVYTLKKHDLWGNNLEIHPVQISPDNKYSAIQTYEKKMLITTYHEGNTSQKYNPIPSHTWENGPETSVGEDVKEKEPSYTC